MKRIAMLFLLCAAIQTLAQSPYSSLQIPKVISYQGRVTQNGVPWNPGTGEGYFVFALVQNGSVLWNNYDGNANPTDPASVGLGVDQMLPLPVSGGQFSVRLGDTGTSGKNREIPATVFFDANSNAIRGGVKLAVWFSADANTFTRLSPDVDLASVPYALVAGIAETVQDRSIVTAKLADGSVTFQKVENSLATVLVPPGSVIAFAGIVAPPGWTICDGSAPLRANPSFTRLFSIIGTTYGVGDGVNTFNLPDLRGRTVIGAGTGQNPTLTNRTIATKLGQETHTLSINEMPEHSHRLSLGEARINLVPVNPGTTGGNSFKSGYAYFNGDFYYNFTNGDHTSLVGGNQAHNTMQPSLVLNYIIKL